MVIMEVDEGLQSLLTNHPDLRLCQWSLQFCRKTEANKRTQTHGSLPNVGDYRNVSVSLKGQLYCLKMKVELTYPAWLHQQPLLHRIQSGSANKGRGGNALFSICSLSKCLFIKQSITLWSLNDICCYNVVIHHACNVYIIHDICPRAHLKRGTGFLQDQSKMCAMVFMPN